MQILLRENEMIYVDCAGELKGLQVKLSKEMIAQISFNAAAQHTVIKLKKDQSCQILTDGKLAGYLPHGSEVILAETVETLKRKFGL